jgi:cysteine desulfurase family protein (TIGR01976 family)
MDTSSKAAPPGGAATKEKTMPQSVTQTFPIEWVRQQFPSMQRTYKNKPAAYFDGPGGTQVVGSCIEAIAGYMRQGCANLHGLFPSSVETEERIMEARKAVGDLLHVAPREVAFGANTTSLALAASRAVGRAWKPGDEVVVTELDHRANVDPWILQAQDKGATVRWIEVDTGTCTLDLSNLDRVINRKTRFVAVGLASNGVGTVNDVARVAARAREVGALVAVDAVQAVPHIPVDRDALGADLLMCSAYKFFGPHVGVITVRPDLMERLPVYKLAPAPACIPDRFETGCQNHEAIAGIPAAVDFMASLGSGATRRERLLSAYEQIEAHETRLTDRIRKALTALPGIKLYQAPESSRRTPTVSFTVKGIAPEEVCRKLIEDYSVFIANGDFYAMTLADKLGINPAGWVRAGLSPYNCDEEVDRFIEGMTRLLKGR